MLRSFERKEAALTPGGSGTVCVLGVVPLARIVSVAPFDTGSPTMLFGLAFSFALTDTFRLSSVEGSFTWNTDPRMV